jgi:thiol-disulfide isomerase/thioredoxin
MRKIFCLFTMVSVVVFSSCSKKDTGTDTGGGGGNAGTVDLPVVKLSKASIVADNFDFTTVKVEDKNGNDITGQCTITANNINTNNTKFSTSTIGAVTFKAKLGTATSTGVTVNATDPGPSRYGQKVLVEDYTGAWCGYCPRVAYSLDQLQAANNKVIAVAVHNADALVYSFEAAMRGQYGVTGFPTAIVNRNFAWSETPSQVTDQTNKWAPLGLAIQSTVAGTTISGKVQTQFNVNSDFPMKVVVMLIEDGKVLAQTNYYNATAGSPFFGLGNPIPNYVHNHVLRAASTNIFGDAIPAAAMVKGNIHETTFSFNAAAYDITKCYVVATTVYEDGISGRKGSLNAQIVKAGQTQNFD